MNLNLSSVKCVSVSSQRSGLWHLLVWLSVSLLIASCSPAENKPKKNAIPAIKKEEVVDNHELIFVTHNGPTTYYLCGDNQYAGFEYDLATLFVTEYAPEYKIKFLTVNSISDVIPTLLKGQAHIAAANLSITHLRQELVQFSTPYQKTQQQVIYNSEHRLPSIPLLVKDLAKLTDKSGENLRVTVPASTSFAERLEKFQKTEPTLSWHAVNQTNSESLLNEVASGVLDFTVADSHLVALIQNYHPNLAVAMPLGKPDDIAWALPKNADPLLVRKVNKFLDKIKKNGKLNNLIDRYYGHSKRLNVQDVSLILKLSNTLLPKYAHLFKQAQEDTGLDWRLLAAVSFRESHWDTYNTSPTNVRGLMMLTESTADAMGVTDRLDPKQSIPAGAKYIVKMIETVPERIPEPDRTYMALAAYNIGYAHLEDARILAKRQKMNPDSWTDVKKTLVMLNDPEFYSTAKFGYASGGAPVIFVESIRSYQRILERYQPAHDPNYTNFKVAQSD